LVVYRTRLDALLALARTDAPAAGRFLEEHVEPHYSDVMLPLIQRYRDDAQAELDAVVENVDAALAASDRHNRLATAMAVMLAVLVGVLLTRSIAQPVELLATAAQRVGSGDLDARVHAQRADEVGLLAESFNRMAERLQGTMVSKSYVDDILRSMGEMLLVTGEDDRIRTVNRTAAEQLGWSERELIGRDVHEIVRSADDPGELRITTRNGSVLPVACTPTELNDASGRPRGRVWVAQNILHQKTIERELRRSVEEKEVLLREVHHRVKNNLQVICSLLQLQAADAAAPDIARPLADSERRVRTMALIHEQLYRSGDLAYVDFRAYVEALANNVLASTGGSARSVLLHVDVEPVPLDLDLAILCGLILNELLANALKHAFPDSRSGEIRVRFQQHNGRATLTVADDGIGLGPAANVAAPASLGLRLVRAFARQLGADTTLRGETGTSVTVAFDVHRKGAAAAGAARHA
jgi:two-component sensor histidine kinase/HAMP domain-containing protein